MQTLKETSRSACNQILGHSRRPATTSTTITISRPWMDIGRTLALIYQLQLILVEQIYRISLIPQRK